MTFASAVIYFDVPRSDEERELLDLLEGPGLDLAAGPGSYALYLQDRGLRVTAADLSPGALEVCRSRGCANVAAMDLRSIDVRPGVYGSIIVMGNTLGLHQTPETFSGFLAALGQAVTRGGRLLFTMIDPLDTTDESHLRYHHRNRERGLPPGLTRVRVRYDDLVDEWMDLWMLTEDELMTLGSEAGWRLVEQRPSGPFRVRLLESTG